MVNIKETTPIIDKTRYQAIIDIFRISAFFLARFLAGFLIGQETPHAARRLSAGMNDLYSCQTR